MSINLSKGGKINLSKESPETKIFVVGIGWSQVSSGTDVDVDVSCFCCKYDSTGTPKIENDTDFVFYNQMNSQCGGVVHSADDRDGAHKADTTDNETVIVNTSIINAKYEELSFIASIDQAVARNQKFGDVSDAYIRVYDQTTKKEILKYNLGSDFSSETAVQFGSLSKDSSGHWSFTAIGKGFHPDASKGFTGELADFVKIYGGHLATA